MKKFEIRMQFWAALLAFLVANADAALIEGMNVPAGQTVSVSQTDTMVGTASNNFINGILNNFGLIKDPGDTYIGGLVNNHGIILTEKAFSIQGGVGNGTNKKMINHLDGLIVLTGYIDMYSNESSLENAGRFIVAQELGDGTNGHYGFTAGVLRGAIKNSGTLSFDRNNGSNICDNYAGTLSIINEGILEIKAGTNCDFGESPVRDLGNGQVAKTNYLQIGGETRVDGTFGAHEIAIHKGVLSGNGTLQGDFSQYHFFETVTVSPGAPLGTLTIMPDNGHLQCTRCSVDIELASNDSVDRFQVDGDIYLYNWKLNVKLREGFVPAAGTGFVVVSADAIYDYGGSISYNLPALPDSRTWSVVNTGTEIVITAN